MARTSFTGNLEILKLLDEKGANLEVPTSNGNTPIMWASYAGNHHIVEYLLSRGVSIENYNMDGHNAMDLAISRMQYHCALILYNHGATLRPIEEYNQLLRRIYDLEKFIDYLKRKEEVEDCTIFYIPESNISFYYRYWSGFSDRY